ncbi:hypothetical protein [Sulfitobacter sp. S190]|uniref:hypothetical protein n=1 Tax=Sulfitobacter sp. S190 TaxID=2867022 RepID=UPI0021A93635|nr:hypothetical protein [Sulfitobacter sp. S190]UWR22116.1 hypothetical protein K3756_15770 [Sulfitobacter sp. S190]
MKATIQTFAQSEDGAVTVDWVVLTAAVVGLGYVAASSINGGTTSVGDNVQTYLQNDAPVLGRTP